MSTNNTGGPAFPIVGTREEMLEIGMTLRDYFAAKAMQTLMAEAIPVKDIASTAYRMADIMLKEREK